MFEYMTVEEIVETMTDEELFDLMTECFVDEVAEEEGI